MLTPRSCFAHMFPTAFAGSLQVWQQPRVPVGLLMSASLQWICTFPRLSCSRCGGYKLCTSMCRRCARGRQPHALRAVCSWRHDNLDSRFLNTQTGGAAVPPPPIICVAHRSHVCMYVHAHICVDACTYPRLVADCLAGGPGEGRWMRGKVYRGPRPEQNGVCGRQVYNGGVPMALSARTD